MKKIILLIVALVCNCGYSNSVESPKDNLYPFNGADKQWVQSVFNSMTLDEKIGQLFMVAAYSVPKQNNAEKVKTLISQYKIGGVIFMKGSPVLQVRMTNEFQSMSKVPLSIGIDGEWGLAMRLDSTISYPKQMQLVCYTKWGFILGSNVLAWAFILILRPMLISITIPTIRLLISDHLENQRQMLPKNHINICEACSRNKF